ncbi:MAG: presqualene diphosphate synthase HpnD [Bryobacteraceae bacterium]|nr:presqualene diphosphate synthase HpnD [Bryobacteraceae bacterium]
MNRELADSYAFCRHVARTQAKNFYYSFLLLERPQRDAMCAVYAFMRHCDDLSDGPGITPESGRKALDAWRADLSGALNGGAPPHPLWPAFRDAAERYRIPAQYFHQMIDGVSSDLAPRRITTFEELYSYCYHVASVVGLTVIHIFEFQDPGALALAEKCGVAFQLTNILRDVREDAERGRIYLPAEDLGRFGVADNDIREGRDGEPLRRLLAFEGARARAYFDESRELVGMVGRRSRASMWALIEIYSRLLRRIEDSGYDVMSRRVRLSSFEKSWILAQALARQGSFGR